MSPQPAALRFDQPLDYQVFQRQSATKGLVRVAGRVPPGTDKLEVQIAVLGSRWTSRGMTARFATGAGPFGPAVGIPAWYGR